MLFRNNQTGAADLSMDPKNPDVLYAGFWEVFRTPHSLSSGGPGSGLFKTTDGGKTWTELTKNPGLPAPLWGKVGVSVSGADANRIYAIIEAADGGVFLSNDAGATWTRVNEDRRLRQRAFYYTRIYADPQARDTVYILNTGLYRSTDAGKTLAAIRVPHGDNHDLWIASSDPRRMINGNDGGGNVSTNAGESWTDQDYPTAQFYNVFTTAHVPYHVCGAQQDNSTACVPSSGTGELYAVGGGESGYIAPDPRDVDVFYAGSYGGLLTRINRRTGERRAINIWPDNPMGFSASDITERFQWTFPIVIAPADPKTLYATSQHVWKSTNEGQTWQRISPDLTRHDPATLGPSGGPITLDQTGVETYATVFTLAPSALDGNVIWAGSDDGVVHVTRDGGKNWTNVTPPDLPPFTRISLIDASPHDAGTAYLAGNRYQRSDRAPYVYKTSDYGKTLDEDRQRRAGRRFPARRARGSEAKGTVVPRHRNGLLRLVRRWRRVAAAADRLARHAGPRHSDQERRPRDRHARAIVLRHAEHRRPAAGLAGDHQRARRALRSVGRDSIGVAERDDRLLPEAAGRESHRRDSGRDEQDGPDVHRHAGQPGGRGGRRRRPGGRRRRRGGWRPRRATAPRRRRVRA